MAPQKDDGAGTSDTLAAEALSTTAERRPDPDSHFGKLARLASEARELVLSSAEATQPLPAP
ncbi:MAG: hypothetical protein E5V51_29610, partial [Mesorhizobium sp.]